MPDHILEADYKKNTQLEQIFRGISQRNTILFLGAGASINEDNRFLSKDIIEFYEDKKGTNWQISDIVEFVDTLITHKDHSRDEFDNYVDECLRKYKVTNYHRILSKLNWRQIITTNYDILVENAFKELEGTVNQNLKLITIRDKKEYIYQPANDELKYIKLNGCLTNKKKYKLVFSTEDFNNATKFYRMVLNDLKNLSDKIQFISAGYSFSDPFARKLLEKFDSLNYREKRWIYSIDPNVKEASLPLFSSRKICIIRCTTDDFFKQYEDWESKQDEFFKKQLKITFINKNKNPIILPTQVSKRLYGFIDPLDLNYKSHSITDKQFYEGEEPNYFIVLKQFDVIKKNKITEVETFINNASNFSADSRLIPTIFLKGSFGTGKSTFAYRLIKTLNDDSETLSFEILEPTSINYLDLKELFTKSLSKRIILYFNSIELNSIFKSMLDLRNKLSIDRSSEFDIIIIATVRENILEKYKTERDIKNSFEITVDCKLNKEEIEDLIEKLKRINLVSFRDINEKNILIEKIQNEYNGDSYLSLLELVSNNKHLDDLTNAYSQLSKVAQKAFLFTSFLYQYKILMPSGLLRSIVSKDWDDFRENVVKVEGKGILIQEEVNSSGTDPDLYFRTKHPIISKHLIEIIIKSEEKKFEYYSDIVTHLVYGYKNSTLIIDLFKAIRLTESLNQAQQDRLFDMASESLSEDPQFLLHYAINLQYRRDELSLKKAIEKIIYAESISEKRNHRLIHRRGVITFDLAKLYFFNQPDSFQMFKIFQLIEESRDLLDIKKRMDPCSSYSYWDLINLEMWYLEYIDIEPNDELAIRIKIEELFDTANRTVFENQSRIYELRNRFIYRWQFETNTRDYLDFLIKYYENSGTRPYAIILLFNYYLEKENIEKCEEFLEELSYLTYNKETLRVLFKFYGFHLHIPKYRMKFFELIKTHEELQEMDELRYDYFRYIAESYNYNLPYAFEILKNIHDEFNYLNPDFRRVWIDDESYQPRIFEGIVKKYKLKIQIYIPFLGNSFYIESSKVKLELENKYRCNLYFYLYGISAEPLIE